MVEGMVKLTRLNFLVPVPQVRDLAELNARLRQRCEEDRRRRVRGKDATKSERLEEDRAARLLEKHPLRDLRRAVEQALHIHAHSRDVIAQFLIPQEPWRSTLFNLDGHPHLRGVKVQSPDVRIYGSLLATHSEAWDTSPGYVT